MTGFTTSLLLLRIAAIAMEHGLTLVSRDEQFKKIDGLKREVW